MHAYAECSYVEEREGAVGFREKEKHISGLDGGHPEASPYHASVHDMTVRRKRTINDVLHDGSGEQWEIEIKNEMLSDAEICSRAEEDDKKDMCMEELRDARRLWSEEAVRLARSGADARVKDKAGLSPLHLAVKQTRDAEKSMIAADCAGKEAQEWTECVHEWRARLRKKLLAPSGVYHISGELFSQVFVGECVGEKKTHARCESYKLIPDKVLRAIQVAYGHWRYLERKVPDIYMYKIHVEERKNKVFVSFDWDEEKTRTFRDGLWFDYIVDKDTLRIEQVGETFGG